MIETDDRLVMDNSDDYNGHGSRSHLPLLHKASVKRASHSFAHRWTLLSKDWWLWELIAAATATGAIAVIVIVLFIVDNSPRPDWPSLITVSAPFLSHDHLK